MKVTGRELAAFYDDWPMGPHWSHDGGSVVIKDNGALRVDPDGTYNVSDALGYIEWQKHGEPPPNLIHINEIPVQVRAKELCPEECYRAWERTRDEERTIALVVMVKEESAEGLKMKLIVLDEVIEVLEDV